MKVSASFAMISILVLASTGLAAPFSSLTCDKVISDKVSIHIEDGFLRYRSVSAVGKEEKKLLTALADKAIPSHLLGGYDEVEVEIAIPEESCDFSKAVLGEFSCLHEGELGILVKATMDAWQEKPVTDIYPGTLKSTSLRSKFSGKKGDKTLTFPFKMSVSKPAAAQLSGESDFFFAHYWEADGFTQNPSCKLDKEWFVAE